MEISLGTVSSFTSNIMRWCHDCGILCGTIRDNVFRLVVARFVVLGCAIAALCMVHQKSMTKYTCIYIYKVKMRAYFDCGLTERKTAFKINNFFTFMHNFLCNSLNYVKNKRRWWLSKLSI